MGATFENCEVDGQVIDGLKVITPRVFSDARGFFFEGYNIEDFRAAGIDVTFVQTNHSRSKAGVVRGIHYQLPSTAEDEHNSAQDKLVRVTKGKVFDVAVDMRRDSPTFGKWFGVELSGENNKAFFLPKGFAHGFMVLGDEEVNFEYMVSNLWDPTAEGGIVYNDPTIDIDWPQIEAEILVAEKDGKLPTFEEIRDTLPTTAEWMADV